MQKSRINRRTVGSAAAAAAVGGVTLLLPEGSMFGEVLAGPLAQSPQPTPVSPQPAPRPVRFYAVDPLFAAYYGRVEGPRTMGGAISPRLRVGGLEAQYFEKARLEDHRALNRTGNPAFDFEYGLLVDEMKAVRSQAPVSAERSTVTYDTLETESDPARRVPPPPGYTGNVLVRGDGSAFIPFSVDLSAAPGHNVPAYFWEYMNRPGLFPGGWLHDIGLPITEPLPALVDKGRIFGTQVVRFTNVPITLQAFQRTILTYDPDNPEAFTVERANTGTDYSRIFPERVPNP